MEHKDNRVGLSALRKRIPTRAFQICMSVLLWLFPLQISVDVMELWGHLSKSERHTFIRFGHDTSKKCANSPYAYGNMVKCFQVKVSWKPRPVFHAVNAAQTKGRFSDLVEGQDKTTDGGCVKNWSW
jgi:hypothetical protein